MKGALWSAPFNSRRLAGMSYGWGTVMGVSQEEIKVANGGAKTLYIFSKGRL